MDFTGKVALVTGGGNGIGRATSAAFARHGAKVVVVDRDGAGAEATAGIIRQNGGDAIAVTADVTKSEDVKAYVRAAIETYGRIDCFFNNAGIEGKVAATAEYDEAVFDAGDRREREGRFPRPAPRPAGDDPSGQRRGGQHRFRRRPGRDAGHAGLCGVEARRDRAHQDGGGRSRAPGHPGERRVPGTGRHAHDPCARGTDLARQREPRSASATRPRYRAGATRPRKRSPTWCFSCAPTSPPTRPADSSSSMVGAPRQAAQ